MKSNESSTRQVINSQAAEIALLRLWLVALSHQVPDKARLISDFLEMSEDTEVRALFSTHPESFFANLQETRKVFAEVLRME